MIIILNLNNFSLKSSFDFEILIKNLRDLIIINLSTILFNLIKWLIVMIFIKFTKIQYFNQKFIIIMI